MRGAEGLPLPEALPVPAAGEGLGVAVPVPLTLLPGLRLCAPEAEAQPEALKGAVVLGVAVASGEPLREPLPLPRPLLLPDRLLTTVPDREPVGETLGEEDRLPPARLPLAHSVGAGEAVGCREAVAPPVPLLLGVEVAEAWLLPVPLPGLPLEPGEGLTL